MSSYRFAIRVVYAVVSAAAMIALGAGWRFGHDHPTTQGALWAGVGIGLAFGSSAMLFAMLRSAPR